LWAYEGKKKNKVWLIYAYHRESEEIVASNRRFAVWGKRDIKIAQKLKKRLKRLEIGYDRIGTDNEDIFLSEYGEDRHEARKKHPVGIEGNNCRMRQRIRRAFRRTCYFSKKLSYSTAGKHLK
jgi:IS1 family transposase